MMTASRSSDAKLKMPAFANELSSSMNREILFHQLLNPRQIAFHKPSTHRGAGFQILLAVEIQPVCGAHFRQIEMARFFRAEFIPQVFQRATHQSFKTLLVTGLPSNGQSGSAGLLRMRCSAY
jgi:hypothetical protein